MIFLDYRWGCFRGILTVILTWFIQIKRGKQVGYVKNDAIGAHVYQNFKTHYLALGNPLTPEGDGWVYTPHILCKDMYITFG